MPRRFQARVGQTVPGCVKRFGRVDSVPLSPHRTGIALLFAAALAELGCPSASSKDAPLCAEGAECAATLKCDAENGNCSNPGQGGSAGTASAGAGGEGGGTAGTNSPSNAGSAGNAGSGSSAGGGGSAGAAGNSGAGGSSGASSGDPLSGCTLAPRTPVATLTSIDDVEDGNLVAESFGNWYTFEDADTSADPLSFDVSSVAHAGAHAIHLHPGQYSVWGSGLGVLLNAATSDKQPLDVRAQDGFEFWARSTAPGWVRVNFPDRNSDPAGGVCSTTDSSCYHYFGVDLRLDSTWRRYRVAFDELYQAQALAGSSFDAAGVYQAEFTFAANTSVDFYVDDVGFFKYPSTSYSVSGRRFERNHVERTFRGVARPSLEWAASGDHLSLADFQAMRSWGADTVRLSLNQDFWLSGSASYAEGYEDTLDRVVACAQTADLDVILDLHWSDRGDLQGQPGQQKMADQNSVLFWQQLAAHYANNSRILFELYNEPHDVSWQVWRDGGTTGDFTAVGFQQLYDAVRGTGAENIVLAGGLNWAYDLSGLPEQTLSGFNIGYTVHPYNNPGKQPADWDASFGNIARSRPVVATEFGDTTSCSADYSQAFLDYAADNDLSFTAWAWWVDADSNPCDFPALLSDWNGTPNTAGTAVRNFLSR